MPLQTMMVGILIAAVMFFVGSAPWWVFNFANDFAALHFYLPTGAPSRFAGTDVISLSFGQRVLSLAALNVPVLIGLRFPWNLSYFLLPVGVVVLLIYGSAFYWLLRRRTSLKRDARLLIGSMVALFFGLFLASRFSIDTSGRYFMPMALPFAVAFAAFVADLQPRVLRIGLVILVIGYNGLGLIAAATSVPPGITTQFNLETHIPNDDDAALIAFLEDHGLTHGYTNYWISFRIAFLSGERLQYSATLPEKADLSYTAFFNRYPPYIEATENAERVAYVTANIGEVRERLEAIFAEHGVTYQHEQIGVYHVYYDFAPSVPRPPLTFAG